MPATPKRAGRSARAGSRFPSEILGHNARSYRGIAGPRQPAEPIEVRQLSQDDLAERMTDLGFPWSRATVSEVENAKRSVTTDELFALAGCLQTTVAALLDPAGPVGNLSWSVDIGDGSAPIPSVWAREWVFGEKPDAILVWGTSGENKNKVIGTVTTGGRTSDQDRDAADEWRRSNQ